MRRSSKLQRNLSIALSFILAAILTLIPFPEHWHWFKPEWVSLVVIYWVVALPQTVGVLTAWFVGLGMDIMSGLLLGQYALALAIVAFLASILRNRLRLFSVGQQALIIFVLVGFGQLILLWVQCWLNQGPRTLWYWASTVTSVLFWPVVYAVLRSFQHRFKIV